MSVPALLSATYTCSPSGTAQHPGARNPPLQVGQVMVQAFNLKRRNARLVGESATPSGKPARVRGQLRPATQPPRSFRARAKAIPVMTIRMASKPAAPIKSPRPALS